VQFSLTYSWLAVANNIAAGAGCINVGGPVQSISQGLKPTFIFRCFWHD
jgi:hypothetical protein